MAGPRLTAPNSRCRRALCAVSEDILPCLSVRVAHQRLLPPRPCSSLAPPDPGSLSLPLPPFSCPQCQEAQLGSPEEIFRVIQDNNLFIMEASVADATAAGAAQEVGGVGCGPSRTVNDARNDAPCTVHRAPCTAMHSVGLTGAILA